MQGAHETTLFRLFDQADEKVANIESVLKNGVTLNPMTSDYDW